MAQSCRGGGPAPEQLGRSIQACFVHQLAQPRQLLGEEGIALGEDDRVQRQVQVQRSDIGKGSPPEIAAKRWLIALRDVLPGFAIGPRSTA